MSDTEDRLHQSCYIYFHNTYPHLRGLLCYNLNNSRNAIDGNKNKSMGLQPGRADLTLYYMGRAYFIELKTIDGKQSKVQIEWETLVRHQGFIYSIIRTLDEFKMLVQGIVGSTL